VINQTDIEFTNEGYTLLDKGLKYNLVHKHKHWIRILALEAECAVTLLPPEEQDYMRDQVAKHKETSNPGYPTQNIHTKK